RDEEAHGRCHCPDEPGQQTDLTPERAARTTENGSCGRRRSPACGDAMAGYSQTPLPQKLGIKPGHRVALLQSPEGFRQTLGAVPESAAVHAALDDGEPFDIILYFTDSASELAGRFAALARRLVSSGGLWVAWPKKASEVATDLSEDRVREIGLRAGLVDNKV